MNIELSLSNRPELDSVTARLVRLADALSQTQKNWWVKEPDENHIQTMKNLFLRSHREFFCLHRELKVAGDKRWKVVERACQNFSWGTAKLSKALTEMNRSEGQRGEAFLARAAAGLLSTR